MVDRPADVEVEHEGASDEGFVPTGMPRWVKVFGLAALSLVVLFVVVHLATGGGAHGPGRHGGGDERPTVEEHRPPTGLHHGG